VFKNDLDRLCRDANPVTVVTGAFLQDPEGDNDGWRDRQAALFAELVAAHNEQMRRVCLFHISSTGVLLVWSIPSLCVHIKAIKGPLRITCSNRENDLNFTIETNPEREGHRAHRSIERSLKYNRWTFQRH
jgi:hypothetical protein